MPDSKVFLSRFLHYFFSLFFLCVVVRIFIAEFNLLGTAVTLGFTCLQNRFNLWLKFIGQHFHWFLSSSCLVSTLNSNRKRGEIYTFRKKVEFHPLVTLVKAVKIQTENRHPGQQVCKTSASSIPGVCILKLLLLAKVLIRKRL